MSDELTHFVGARLRDDSERFELFVKILDEGVLKAPGRSDIVVEKNSNGVVSTKVTVSQTLDQRKRLSSNGKYDASIVCFADIPVLDLPLHSRKYGPFGVAFGKHFLVGKGASPVFYVARQSATNWRNPLANNPDNRSRLLHLAKAYSNRGHWENYTRAELYDSADQQLPKRKLDEWMSPDLGTGPIDPDALTIQRFLEDELFPFLKFFDADLSDSSEHNYYMEREWRVIGPVAFTLDDVERVLLPRAYAPQFRVHFPAFHGQFTYIG